MKKLISSLLIMMSLNTMAQKNISYEQEILKIREKQIELGDLQKNLREAQLSTISNVIKIGVSTAVISLLLSNSNKLMGQRNLYALAEGTALRIGATGIAIYSGFKGWDLYLNIKELNSLSEIIEMKSKELNRTIELLSSLE